MSRPSVVIACMFAPHYDRLNRIVAIGIGNRPPDGPIYKMFEVL
ncbi:MAG: hypothetical protein WA851_12990 [Xanthobacteraceae bacterium]|jgi:hypothetical protein